MPAGFIYSDVKPVAEKSLPPMSDRRTSMTERPNHPLTGMGIRPDQLIDLMPCYVVVQDARHRIVFTNRMARQDFGDGVGRQCHEFYGGRAAPCRGCPAALTLQDKAIHLAEATFRSAGGKVVQMLVNASPILDAGGAVKGIVEIATDITLLKKTHKELTTLGQSIALLSHGIKNILEGLQGGAYVVNEAIKDGDMALARKGWNIVDRNILDITDAVQNILYSAKNRPLQYEQVAPGNLIADAVGLYREKAAALGVQLEQRADPELPRANLDAASIRRMLNNLIWNALEACHKDGGKADHRVLVSADFFDPDHFMFQVADNGIGMDEATRRNIFEEFFSTKGSGGTGLGLAVVEKVVNKHGGRVEVRSSPGQGSTFTVIFKLR